MISSKQIPLVSASAQSVFEVVARIEPGKIITYKDIAEILGKPGGSQAAGNAVGKGMIFLGLQEAGAAREKTAMVNKKPNIIV